MNTPEDPIDALLREQTDYIDDAGFTARVVGQLPHRRRRWSRPLIILTAVALGSLLALRWLPWENLPPLTLSLQWAADLDVLLPWFMVLLVAAALVTGVISALQNED